MGRDRSPRSEVSAPFKSLRAVDPLTEALAYARPRLEGANTIGDRLRTLWAAVVAARDIGPSNLVEEEFFKLARDTGLAADLGSRADADLRHVIRWAMLGMNPFQ
jgi:hypothetical protein